MTTTTTTTICDNDKDEEDKESVACGLAGARIRFRLCARYHQPGLNGIGRLSQDTVFKPGETKKHVSPPKNFLSQQNFILTRL